MGGRGGGKGGRSGVGAASSASSAPGSVGNYVGPDGKTYATKITMKVEDNSKYMKMLKVEAVSMDGKNQLGYIEFVYRPTLGQVQTKLARVHVQRQGLGGKLYAEVMKYARAQGANKMVSDEIVSYRAAGQWEKMVKQYGGRKNPSSFNGEYNIGKNDKPVYEVDLR